MAAAGIQYVKNGPGFVLHKVHGDWEGRCSAWYDKNGNIVDAEQIINVHDIRLVKTNGRIWNELQKIGSFFASAGS